MLNISAGQIWNSYSLTPRQVQQQRTPQTARPAGSVYAAAANVWTGEDGDTVELSSQASAPEQQGKDASADRRSVASLRGLEYDPAAAKRQRKSIEDSGKLMEVFRRIASGAKVPVADQKKLMEASPGMYQTAKLAAQMAENDKEYKSLWKDEDRKKGPDARHAADISEPSVSRPHDDPLAAAAVDAAQDVPAS
ncbi:MAG: hypothetical protein HDQ87_10000 [Clostridia bacterium]|nr:hypothetical protein [Clostridia bacterium]